VCDVLMNIIISGFQIHWVFPQWSRIVLQPDQKRFKVQLMLLHTLLSRRHGCLSVSTLCSELNGPGLSPGWGHCIYHPIQGRVEILLPNGCTKEEGEANRKKELRLFFLLPMVSHVSHSACIFQVQS